MNSKKRLLRNSRLYLVLDKDTAKKRDLIKIAKRSVLGGVDILQLRWKEGSPEGVLKAGEELRRITKKSRVLFIVDDNVNLTNILDADGVHLGHEDLSIKSTRAVLGQSKIIGFSTHSYSQAKKAVSDGADYISIGPIFKTPIKADYKPTGLKVIKRLKQNVRLPIFAIGGINLNNIERVIKNGAERTAVVRAIVRAKDPYKAAKELKRRLHSQ